jgi:hypothetical protein
MITASILSRTVFQQGEEGGLLALLTGTTGLLCATALVIIAIIGFWRTFEKAGQPGWGAIIPIYNAYLLLKIAGRPGWWLILLLIPLVNVIIWLLVSIDIAQSFGKSAAWGVILLFLLNGLGFLILGFSDAQYVGPAAAQPVKA